MSSAKLLTEPTNYAVVQLPERQFPGVVIQGDSLSTLVSLLEEALVSPDESRELIEEVLDILKGAQGRYEATCAQSGIELPYVRRG